MTELKETYVKAFKNAGYPEEIYTNMNLDEMKEEYECLREYGVHKK